VTWEKFPRNVTGILERIRDDVGADVSLADFQGPGTLDSFWAWIGISGPTTPAWLKATVHSISTPFGNGLDLSFFLTSGDTQLAVSVLSQTNAKTYFPGLNFELYEYPVHVAGNLILVTPRVGAWAQPPGLLADSGAWKWGGLWSLSVEVPLDEGFGLWLEGSEKTEGWATGIDDPSSGWDLRTGFHWML